MSSKRRHRPRRHSATTIEFGHEPYQLWVPQPDDPIVIARFEDAAGLAFEALDLPAEREVLVLLDACRHLTAMLLDPPSPIGVMIGLQTDLGVDFCQTISIVLLDHIEPVAPAIEDVEGFRALRTIHLSQGIQLLDVLLISPDHLQSLSIASDPDSIWFDEFEPMPAEP